MLGIGATTAIFSVVDGIVLRRLPYPDQERLVYFNQGSHTVPEYREWLERITTFDEIVAIWPAQRTLLGAGSPQQIVLGQATANTFPVFDASPALGRLLTLADIQANAPVAVLSYAFWVRQFGGDGSVLGRSIQLDARSGASDDPVIITRTHAERFFGDENPIGQTFLMGSRTVRSYTVIGVARWADARARPLRDVS